MCSGSEAGLHLRLIDFEYHSTLGLRVIKKKKKKEILIRKARVDADGRHRDAALQRQVCRSREWRWVATPPKARKRSNRERAPLRSVSSGSVVLGQGCLPLPGLG